MKIKSNQIFNFSNFYIISTILAIFVVFGISGALINQRIYQFEKQRYANEFSFNLDLNNPYSAYRWLEQRLSDDMLPFDSNIRDAIRVVIENEKDEKLALSLIEDPGNYWNSRTDLYRILIKTAPNPDVLYAYLTNELGYILDLADQRNSQRGLQYGWTGAYYLETALMAYEETEQIRFLNLARESLLEILSNRDDKLGFYDEIRNRTLKAWGTDHIDEDGRFTNIVTHAGRIASVMAWYSWIVEQDQTLDERHQSAAESLSRAAKTALKEFEDEYKLDGDSEKYGYYWRNSENRIEPLNHLTSIGIAFLYLSDINSDEFSQSHAEQINNFVRNVMYKDRNGTVIWQYSSSPEEPDGSRPEPVWKGQVTIRYMFHAERLGFFTQREVESVAKTITTNVIRDDGTINAYISSDFESLYDYANHRHGGLVNIIPYIILEEFNEKLGPRIETTVSAEDEFGGWLSGPLTSIAYAYRL